MKKINLIGLAIGCVGLAFLLMSGFLSAEERTNPARQVQIRGPSEQVLQYVRDHPVEKRLPEKPKLSPERAEELQKQLRFEMTNILFRLYKYEPGRITLKFDTRETPDRMTKVKDEIDTGDSKLDALLKEHGFTEFRVVGTGISRSQLSLRTYKYAFVSSHELKNKAGAFQRMVNRGLTKLMKGFKVELYPNEDKPYHELLSLNLEKAREYLKNKDIHINLWGKEMTFEYGKNRVDSFSLEVIQAFKLHPKIANASITPVCYPGSGDPNQGAVVDYYAQKQMWNLDYSTGGYYPKLNQAEEIDWFWYSLNPVYDEDVDIEVMWNNNYDISGGGIIVQTGQPVVVAVIDTGIDFAHPEFQQYAAWGYPTGSRIWINAEEDINGNGIFDPGDINNIDDDGNGYIDDVAGFNFFEAEYFLPSGPYFNYDYIFPGGQPSSMPYDDYGHGTVVASILGAADNGQGVKGIAYSSNILPIKVTNYQGTSSTVYVTDGLEYVTYLKEMQDVNIVAANLSLAGYAYDELLSDAVREATDAGITVVLGMGNNMGQITPGSNYMLDFDAVDKAIMVGANDYNGDVPLFSNWGEEGVVDVVAPGVDIITARSSVCTLPASAALPLDNNGYFQVVGYGTSLSAPHVSGFAALIAASYPGMSPAVIQQMIRDTAEPLYEWDDPLQTVSSLFQGSGKVNTTGIVNSPQAPIFTSNPPTTATAYVAWEYQAGADGIIDPVFDWAGGTYHPPTGMQLDRGIGLITWTPTNANWGANQVWLVAKSLAEPTLQAQQQFTVTISEASTNPGDYINLEPPLVGELYPEEDYYPNEESYRLPVHFPAPFVELPTSITTWITPTQPVPNYVHYGVYPEHEAGMLVNNIPLAANGLFNFVPGCYPLLYGWFNGPSYPGYTGPDWWVGVWIWQNILGIEQGWAPGSFFPPFAPVDHELLLYNPPAFWDVYDNPWDIEAYRLYTGEVVIYDELIQISPGGSYEPPYGAVPTIIDLETSQISPLVELIWREAEPPEQYEIQPEGNIYYTNTRTNTIEPLVNTKIEILNLYINDPAYLGSWYAPSSYIWRQDRYYCWTDENGYFTLGIPMTWTEGYPPVLYIHAVCKDGTEVESPIIAEVVKSSYTERPYNSEPYNFSAGSIEIVLTPSGTDLFTNTWSNILMEIYDSYQFLEENTSGLPVSYPGESPVRDKIICYFPEFSGNYYNSLIDRICLSDTDPTYPGGVGWYEIINNYALAVMQLQCEAHGIEEINWDGGTQDFHNDLSWLDAFKWGFADFVALRVHGEEQININYLGQIYDIENTDFEDLSDISDPARSEGVCGGISLDVDDANCDFLDETGGSMQGNFADIFQNMINTAAASTVPGYEFNIITFYTLWDERGYPAPEQLYGIYSGHGLTVPWPQSAVQVQQGP